MALAPLDFKPIGFGINSGILFDNQRALKVFSILDEAWRAKQGVFSQVLLPQDMFPQTEVPLTHWYFYSALTQRGGVISEDPIRTLFKLSISMPELFDPTYVTENLSEEDVLWIFLRASDRSNPEKDGSMGYKDREHAKSWLHNSRVLHQSWNADPLTIFAGANDFFEAFNRINRKSPKTRQQGIMGMRRKIFALLTIWYQEKGLVPIFPTPIPVDFHALRVLWATGIIEIPTKTLVQREPGKGRRYPPSYLDRQGHRVVEKTLDTIALWSQLFLTETGIPHLTINPALWMLSRRLCANHFQNMTRGDGKIIHLAKDLTHPDRWPKRYADPCQSCPIKEFCTKAIPSSPYYKEGLLIPDDRILDTPIPELPLGGMEQVLYSGRGSKEPGGKKERPKPQILRPNDEDQLSLF